MILQLFNILTSLYLIPCVNRYLGSTEQKAQLSHYGKWLGTRATGYIVYAIAAFGLAVSCGIKPANSLILSLLLTGAFILFRQRSPRGAMFAIHGRATPGKVNAISAWLVRVMHGLPVSIITTGSREQLLRYGRLYGFWHGLWGLLVGSIPIALLYSAYAPIAALFGGLMGLCYYLAGPYGGIFHNEEGALERAEYATGLFVIFPFTIISVLAAAS